MDVSHGRMDDRTVRQSRVGHVLYTTKKDINKTMNTCKLRKSHSSKRTDLDIMRSMKTLST